MAKPEKKKTSLDITPLGDRVVVTPLDLAETEAFTKSGIIIPETVDKEKPFQGKVVAVGPGKWNEDGDGRVPMTVKKGQKVVFSKYSPDEVKINDVTYYVVSESSILAIID